MLKIIFFVLGICIADVVSASSNILPTVLPDAQLVGKGKLTYMVWDVYNATLYAPKGQWNKDKPFALKLDYLREISGKDIAGAAVSEMRQQGFTDEVKLAEWYAQMEEIFPDVGPGTALMGIYKPNQATAFYNQNGELVGQVKDPEFGKYFFAIWLGENTSRPMLRANLLNTGGK